MKFDYESLLSGCSIFVEDIGTFKPTVLDDIKPPPHGIGTSLYNHFLAVLSQDIDDFSEKLSKQQSDLLKKNDKFNTFDYLTFLKPEYRNLLHQAFVFFMTETIIWDEKQKCFFTLRQKKEGESVYVEDYVLVGKIDRKNYDEVRDMILQMNYISLGKSAEPKHATSKAKKYWDIQQQKKKEAAKTSGENNYLTIGNIISKLCAAPTGYGFHNIYSLTIYQLYDQFFQYSNYRMSDLGSNAYATHGGEKYKPGEWMKPVPELLKQ